MAILVLKALRGLVKGFEQARNSSPAVRSERSERVRQSTRASSHPDFNRRCRSFTGSTVRLPPSGHTRQSLHGSRTFTAGSDSHRPRSTFLASESRPTPYRTDYSRAMRSIVKSGSPKHGSLGNSDRCAFGCTQYAVRREELRQHARVASRPACRRRSFAARIRSACVAHRHDPVTRFPQIATAPPRRRHGGSTLLACPLQITSKERVWRWRARSSYSALGCVRATSQRRCDPVHSSACGVVTMRQPALLPTCSARSGLVGASRASRPQRCTVSSCLTRACCTCIWSAAARACARHRIDGGL